MNNQIIKKLATFLMCSGLVVVAACGRLSTGGGDGDSYTTSSSTDATSTDDSSSGDTPKVTKTKKCGPDQVLVGHTALWSHRVCDSFETAWVTPETLDSDTGHQLADLEVSHGAISIKYTGLHNDKMGFMRETFGIYFQAVGLDGKEASWRWTSFMQHSGSLKSRLALFRLDSGCVDPNDCDTAFNTEHLQFLDETETYQWDCKWNNTKNRLYCDITKPADKEYRVHTFNMTNGRMNSLRFLGVGQNAFTGDYPSYNATPSDFKVTIFD